MCAPVLLIGNYYPHFPPRPPTPPTASGQQAPDVPLAQFKAAQSANATHLSADGLRAYIEYEFSVRVCYWDDESKRFGSSFPCEQGLPADAVRM